MLVIRLRRIGKKNQPTYRVVVAENSFPVDGKFTADLGFYNPHTKQHNLKKEEVLVWLNKGARPSNSIAKILDKNKVKHGSIVVVKKDRKAKNEIEETAKKAPAAESVAEPTEETPEATSEEATSPEVTAAEPEAPTE